MGVLEEALLTMSTGPQIGSHSLVKAGLGMAGETSQGLAMEPQQVSD